MVGDGSYPAYAGDKSMYDVHKYMGLGATEFNYFIQQVGLAAASFGVTDEDVNAVGMALTGLFGYKCAPAATVIKSQGAQLQAICIEVSSRVQNANFILTVLQSDCPTAPTADCSAYGAIAAVPATATASSSKTSKSATATKSSKSTGTGTMSATATNTAKSGTGSKLGPAAAVVGVAALAFAL